MLSQVAKYLVVRQGFLSQAGLKLAILLPQKSWHLHCILQRTTSLQQMRQSYTLVHSRAGSLPSHLDLESQLLAVTLDGSTRALGPVRLGC